MLLSCRWVAFSLSLLVAFPAAGAVFTVTKTNDDNDGACDADCSLREAVQAANLVPGSTVVVPAGHYRLSLPPPERILNNPGDGSGGNLLVNTPMAITGAGRAATIIDARPPGEPQGVDRVLAVFVNGDLSLSGVTITGGALPDMIGGFGLENGAGIQVLGGKLRISDSAIAQNFTNGAGGGLAIANNARTPAELTITRTEIVDNLSLGTGGGIFSSNSTVTITDSSIRGNRSVRGGGGGVMNMNTGTRDFTPMALLRVLRSTIADNVSGNPAIDPLVGGVGGGSTTRAAGSSSRTRPSRATGCSAWSSKVSDCFPTRGRAAASPAGPYSVTKRRTRPSSSTRRSPGTRGPLGASSTCGPRMATSWCSAIPSSPATAAIRTAAARAAKWAFSAKAAM